MGGMGRRPLLALFSLVLTGSLATAAAADERGAVEEVLDDIGLFKSTIDADSLERGEAGLEDPPPDVLEDEEDGDGEDEEPRGEPFVAPIPFRSPTLGWGGALAGGSIYPLDQEVRDYPPSTLTLAG